jgi:hypothetical protein
MFVRYAFLADAVSIDVNGKLNAMGIFDNVLSTSFPTLQREMVLAVNLEGSHSEKGEHKITIEFRNDKDDKIFGLEQKIELGSHGALHSNPRAALITKLRDLLFQKQGQYQFVIFADDRFLGRILFMAQKITIGNTGEA